MNESVSDPYPRIVQVVTTVDTREAAESIAHELVKSRLAGCVQLSSPVCSTYSWLGNIEQSMEFRLTIKTLQKKLDELIAKLQLLHPYDTPEVLWMETHTTLAYFQWLDDYLTS